MKSSIRRINRLDLVKSNSTLRPFTTSSNRCQIPVEKDQPHPVSPGPKITTHTVPSRVSFEDRRWTSQPLSRRPIGLARRSRNASHASHASTTGPEITTGTPNPSSTTEVGVFIDGEPQKFSAFLLRDMCECSACVDTSTKQKFFSSADVPLDIRARATAQTSGAVSILWDGDIPGYPRNHKTEISTDVLRSLAATGVGEAPYEPGSQVLWDSAMFEPVQDFDYEAYMEDDAVLYQAVKQLHSHGLLFVSNVPESEKSVSTIGERIGPIKNTFYGYTWDVRSVPEAINVAYTSQDLGFHMDLLYMHQPPHLQLLHCIRSSAKGGASLFTDSYRAAQELFQQDPEAFTTLSNVEATFHYNHPQTNLYRQQRPVFEMKPLKADGIEFKTVGKLASFHNRNLAQPGASPNNFNVTQYIEDVNWSPPFQGPMALKTPERRTNLPEVQSRRSPLELLNLGAGAWHAAARTYSALIHKPAGIYERLMRPGECVIFDNRRVLHARKAFEVGDAGVERWLRGAYLDKDPYVSQLRVLQKRFRDFTPAAAVSEVEDGGRQYFETAMAV